MLKLKTKPQPVRSVRGKKVHTPRPFNETAMWFNVPRLIEVQDYHEFDNIKDYLERLGVHRPKVAEVGFNGRYVGVVYTGRKPGQQSLNWMSDVQGIKLHLDEPE